MLRSTVTKRFPTLRSVITLLMISLMALAVVVTCVSCGKSSSHGDTTDTGTKAETSADMDIETTTATANLTQEMYDSIELGMSYEQVRDIIGQDPNKVEEVPDEVRETGEVTRCSWIGDPESTEYPEPPQIDVSFYEGEACEKMSTSI